MSLACAGALIIPQWETRPSGRPLGPAGELPGIGWLRAREGVADLGTFDKVVAQLVADDKVEVHRQLLVERLDTAQQLLVSSLRRGLDGAKVFDHQHCQR